MSLVVQKYGGTSVGTLDHIRRVAGHVRHTVAQGHKVIVTISAMGEQTDDLLDMALKLNPKPPRRELDMLLTAGERISAALLAIALDDVQVASVSLTGSQCGILTDETHGNARITNILGDRIRDGLAVGKVVIVAGFQGMSPRTREITTLGRGGSDLSAVAIAAALKADVCQLYKDVRGIYSADPRMVPGAKLLPQVSYHSLTELAWGGASVLHPRSVHLAEKYGLPFEVRSSLELDVPGTTISKENDMESPKVEAIAQKTGLSMVVLRSSGAGLKGLMSHSLSWLWQHGEAPTLGVESRPLDDQTELVQFIKSSLVEDYVAALKAHVAHLGGTLDLLRRVDQLATVSVVGQGFKQSPELIEKALSSLAKGPLLCDVSNTVLCLGIMEADLQTTVKALHEAVIEQV